MSLAERLTRLRKEKGLTQLNLAEKLDVSRQAISRWEAGSAVPSTENLKFLSDLYGVSVDFLLNGNDEEVSSEKEKPSGNTGTAEKVRKWIIVGICTLIVAIVLAWAATIPENDEGVSINEIPERNWDRTSGAFSIDW